MIIGSKYRILRLWMLREERKWDRKYESKENGVWIIRMKIRWKVDTERIDESRWCIEREKEKGVSTWYRLRKRGLILLFWGGKIFDRIEDYFNILLHFLLIIVSLIFFLIQTKEQLFTSFLSPPFPTHPNVALYSLILQD